VDYPACEDCYVPRRGLTAAKMTMLLVFAWTSLLHAQSSRILRTPRNMSFGGIMNQIQEYSDGSIPDALGSRFDGSSFRVAVVVNRDGFVNCDYDDRGNTRLKKQLHVSDNLIHELADSVCSSVRTWKFRPLIIEERAYAFLGPIVVNIERQKFVLPDPDPRWQYNPPPVRRKSGMDAD